MSNITPSKSEKSELNSSGTRPVESVVEKVFHLHKDKDSIPAHKARLHELFSLIDKEFDALYEENQECMYLFYLRNAHFLFCVINVTSYQY